MKRIILFLLIINTQPIHGQIITTIAGTGIAGFSGDGGQAILAELNDPSGIATDRIGNIYVADHVNNAIRKIDTSGVISTIIGDGTGYSSCGYLGDGGPAISAKICDPSDIVLDSIGNLFFSDGGNNVIRKIDTNGIITTYAGTGVFGYSGDGGLAINAEFSYPGGLALDRFGNLYATDYSYVIVRKIDTNGIITTFAGGGIENISDGGPATNAAFGVLSGVAFDQLSGNLYIADYTGIRKVDSLGIITTIANWHHDTGIAVDATGNVYLSSYATDIVRKVDVNGIETIYAGNGNTGFSGDGGTAVNASMRPHKVATDASGNLYISDETHRIRKVSYCAMPLPLSINHADTICGGNPTTLTATGANSYSWSANAGNAVTDTVIVNPVITTHYYVTGIAEGCISTYTTTLVVNPILTIDGVCEGDSAILIASGASSYVWGSNANNATTDSVSVYGLTLADFTVIGTDSNGCVSSYSYELNCLSVETTNTVENNEYLTIYPNPNNGTFTLEANLAENGMVRTEVRNLFGQLVYAQDENAAKGLYRKNIDMDLAKGIYLITLQTAEGSVTKKVEVVK